MGVPGLYSEIDRISTPNTRREIQDKKYDYLVIDYNSVVHNIYRNFANEINIFIRIIYYLNYSIFVKDDNILMREPKISKIINFIINRYSDFMIGFFRKINIELLLDDNKYKLFSNLLDKNEVVNKTYKIYNNLSKLNNIDRIILYISNEVYEYTKKLSENTIKSIYPDIYSRTYLFFDGLPLIGKVFRSKKIGKSVLKKIKRNFYGDNILKKIDDLLLKEGPPEISPNSDLYLSLREKLSKIEPIKGKFYVNDETIIMEAEQQIFHFMNNNEIFKNNEILLYSPDSDTILLCLINSHFNIDLMREELINEKNDSFSNRYEILEDGTVDSPFKKKITYYDIKQLAINLEFDEQQYCWDITFLIIIIFGNDFIPKNNDIKLSYLEEIKNIYEYLVLKNSETRFMIINIEEKSIIFENFIKYLDIYYESHHTFRFNDSWESMVNKRLQKTVDEYNEKIDFYHYKSYLPKETLDKFERIYFLEEGFYWEGKYEYLIKELKSEQDIFRNRDNIEIMNVQFGENIYEIIDNEIINDTDNEESNIKNYVCSFGYLFDLYFKNNLRDKFWHYEKKKCPKYSLLRSYLLLNKDNPSIIDYAFFEERPYINKEELDLYKGYIKETAFKKFKTNIEQMTNQKLEQNYHNEFLIYENVKKIFYGEFTNMENSLEFSVRLIL